MAKHPTLCPPGTFQGFHEDGSSGCVPFTSLRVPAGDPTRVATSARVVHGGLGSLCQFIPNERARRACEVAAELAGGLGGDDGGFGPSTTDFPCDFGYKKDPITNSCVPFFFGEQPGREPEGVGGGDAIMGRYGAGYTPDVDQRVHLNCLPGDVLGTDNICYPKRSLRNDERKYPRGRRPLLTGGEMRAISIASGAARRVARTQKRLQKLGMLPKPAARKAAPKQKLIAGGPGITVIDTE